MTIDANAFIESLLDLQDVQRTRALVKLFNDNDHHEAFEVFRVMAKSNHVSIRKLAVHGYYLHMQKCTHIVELLEDLAILDQSRTVRYAAMKFIVKSQSERVSAVVLNIAQNDALPKADLTFFMNLLVACKRSPLRDQHKNWETKRGEKLANELLRKK